MPWGRKPTCSSCKSTTATLWRKDPDGNTVCDSCFNSDNRSVASGGGENNSENGDSVTTVKPHGGGKGVSTNYVAPVRKSARIKPSRHKYQNAPKALATKGRSRRVIFKKNPIKAAPSVATVVTSSYIFHNDQYWQNGDIVSVMDVDGGIYYAQIRGFLQDQYCNKMAVITWLLPTTASPTGMFDPATFILGPEEELPRHIDCFEFVCHAPSEYFKARNSPYPTKPTVPELGYVWGTLGPKIEVIPSKDEVYGLSDKPLEKCSPTKGKKDKNIVVKVKEEKRPKRETKTKETKKDKDKEKEPPKERVLRQERGTREKLKRKIKEIEEMMT